MVSTIDCLSMMIVLKYGGDPEPLAAQELVNNLPIRFMTHVVPR